MRSILRSMDVATVSFVSGPPGIRTVADELGIEHQAPGPALFAESGQIKVMRTIYYNLKNYRSFLMRSAAVRNHILSSDYKFAIIDFEPIAARAIRDTGLRALVFDSQTLSCVPRSSLGLDRSVSDCAFRAVTKLCYGRLLKTAGSILTQSLIPCRGADSRQEIIPPCIPTRLAGVGPVAGNHVFCYSSITSFPLALIALARRHPQTEFRIYGNFAGDTRSVPENVIARPHGHEAFADDIASSRLVYTYAGFQTIALAVLLGKPLVVCPIGKQWEQVFNTRVVRNFKLGRVLSRLSIGEMEEALGHDRQAPVEVREWIESGKILIPEIIRARVRDMVN